MKEILILLFYIAGCVLTHYRLYGSFYECDEAHPNVYPKVINCYPLWVCFVLLSWFTFLCLSISYFIEGDKYFFKFNNKELLKRHFYYKEKHSNF